MLTNNDIEILDVIPHYDQDKIKYLTIQYKLNGVPDSIDIALNRKSSHVYVYTDNDLLVKSKKEVSQPLLMDIAEKAMEWNRKL